MRENVRLYLHRIESALKACLASFAIRNTALNYAAYATCLIEHRAQRNTDLPSVSGETFYGTTVATALEPETVHGKPLVYLDNAATTQKPRAVLDALMAYYSEDNANVHRGVHPLSERATHAFEDARATVQRFINAASTREIVFTRNATEAVNLVAQTFGRTRLGPGDEVVISAMEHHSNIVPWQMVCGEKGASLRVIPITDEGALQLEEYERLLGPHTRLVSIVHLSNVLGTINPVQQMIATAHRRGVPVLVDGPRRPLT